MKTAPIFSFVYIAFLSAERLVLEYDQAKRLVALSSARGVDTLDKDTGKAMSTR